ncbi:MULTISPECIES: MFS transporter [unclassified Nocardioides]|uniref:MFS transporter n=1 Tax=unclassified Nocardioides TaxID=2615069 RepID=UPI0007035FDA|nr:MULTISPECIES: MFS transporter [unclassified Nocardioides]KRC53409.1 MFS transporter [Nocardioides sp. Root79]KRC68115.1 MFS transporter [Nocardioides sp. Root240]
MTSTLDPATSVEAPSATGPATYSRLVLPAMAANVFLLSLIQTVVVPALPLIGQQLSVSATTVGWVATATMLTASAVTPLFGRLGDVFGNRLVILVVLALTLVGSVLAAVGDSIGVLLAGRVLQGASFGLFPLAISVLRQELPHERLHHGMSIAATALGFGSGFALVATGVLTNNGGDYHRIFWLTVAASALMLVLSAVALPRRAGRGGRVDYTGAVVLGTGLVALLLPVSQGHEWGWTAPLTLGLFGAAVVVLLAFGVLQSRTEQPLIALSLLSHRPVLATNLASLFVGYGMFSVFLGATYFVQAPDALTGYGFDASILRTSLVYMLPGTLLAIPLGPISGHLVGRYGARPVLLSATLLGIASMSSLALFHDHSAEFIVALVAGNAAIAVAYAAMPALLVRYVAPHDTGIANSVNSIMRTVGGAIGSAIVITILAASSETVATPVGPVSLPTEGAYQLSFALGAGAFVLAALLAALGFRGTSPYRAEVG